MSSEKRYYISSCLDSVEDFLSAVRFKFDQEGAQR